MTCGDGEISFGEECEGDDLLGQDCTDAGMFDGGNLACDPVACTLDVSDCSVCGDMIVNGNEDCDTGDLDGGDCAGQGFPDGGMLACDDASCTYDTDMCTGDQCGDSVIDMGESCDTNELAGNTCEDEGFTGGSLDCMPLACGFDTSECSNNVIAVCSGDLGLAFDNLAPLINTQSPMNMGTVGDVDVYVDLLHTFNGDIDMQLRHVGSDTTVDLVFDDCGTQEDMQAYFNDEGNGPADCVSPIAIEGNLTPETPLSAIDGELIASDWELIITDDAGGDNGVLNSWCLYITED